MRKALTANWTATTDRAESSYGFPAYVAATCPHGRKVAHSLDEALRCGMLQAVRAERGLTQQQLATALGASLSAVSRWEQGTRTPTGLYRERLEEWLLGTYSPQTDATAS